jgi:sugar/nucleoside kinase (ribokinase family)
VGRTWDILGAGAVTVDDLLYVDEYPAAESKIRVKASDRQVGGLTATALVAAARLGARCAFAGVLGRDELSELVMARLSAEGIDLAGVVRRDAARPRHSTIIVDLSRDTRTVLVDTGGIDEDPGVPAEAAVSAAAVLFLDHTHGARMLRLARAARARGVPTVADFERDTVPELRELIELTDHLILPWSLARVLTGAHEPAHAVERLWTARRAAVVVTRGDQGAWYGAAGAAASHQRAFRVPVVDTTGCGDVFHGAYAAALAEGLPAAERVRLASAAAAIKAMRRGGQAGIPTAAEVRAFLAERA